MIEYRKITNILLVTDTISICTVICTVRVFVCTVSNHIHCDMYRARIRVHGI